MGTWLRRAGFGLMALVTTLAVLFAAGETAIEPGGWLAVGLIASWAVPLAVCSMVAWWRPMAGSWLLGALTGVLVVGAAWFALDPAGWRWLENAVGPVRALATLVVTGALAVLGLRRPGVAGLLLVVAGAAPPLISGSRGGGLSSLAAIGAPAVVAGVLYLLAARSDRSGLTPREPAAPSR